MEGSFTPPTIAGTGQSGFEETPIRNEGGQFPPGQGGPTPPLDGPPPGPPHLPPVAPIPWEEPGRALVNAFVDTITLLYSRCSEAFARMPLNSELLKPIIFAILVGMIGAVAETVYNSIWSMTIWKLFPWMDEQEHPGFGVFGNFVALFFMPLLIPMFLVIASAITHIMLILLGAGNRGWTATFRVSCYASASALCQVIPFVGGLASGIVGLIFATHGLAVVHGTSRGRALFAQLLPAAICCGVLSLGLLVFGSAMLAGFKELWNK
ncbi:MAG TPA: YIP1 family protein [Candidatus Eisenbacteria bacterium]